MNKLLSAGFVRMFKSKAFLAIAALIAAGAIYLRLFAHFKAEESVPLDAGFFVITGFIGIVMAAFCSLFVGTEYSDGTIRNKLATGHSRGAVYLSYLILCAAAGIMFLMIYWLASIIIGIPLSSSFVGSVSSMLLPAALSCAIVLAYCSVFILIAVINQNKAATSVITLMLAFAMLFIATFIQASLEEPEYYPAYAYAENGELLSDEAVPNKEYLRGTKRDVYEFMFDFLPSCQGLRLGQVNKPTPQKPLLAVYSLIISLLATGAGAAVFKKKNIK